MARNVAKKLMKKTGKKVVLKSVKKVSPNMAKLFCDELERCILLSDEDKDFFLKNAKSFPASALQSLHKLVKTKNTLIEKYVRLALSQDKDHLYLSELKAKIRKLQLQSKKFAEEGEKNDVDADLLKKLSEI